MAAKGAPWWQGWWQERQPFIPRRHNLGKLQANTREDAAKAFTSKFRNLIERAETQQFELVVEHTQEPGVVIAMQKRKRDGSDLFKEGNGNENQSKPGTS